MRIVVGLQLGGPVVTSDADVRLGAPVWGPAALVRDLELRLGIAPREEIESVRLPGWLTRIRSLGSPDAFYAKSFGVDELGAAVRLVEWRDALVEAGWNGEAIPNGGDRLAALAALEQHDPEPPHRLAAIEGALTSEPASPLYESIHLIEPRELWPGRWRRIFDRLAEQGTWFARYELELPPAADSESDLGLLQRSLRGEPIAARARGDGSVLVLRGDTPGDLAELTAMLLAKGAPSVVVRCRDGESLDHALVVHGLPSQGHAGESVWRPAMQLLALALELAFEPRDPFRVLELLTLPLGPFRGLLGVRLARAVARQPGTGGKEWILQKGEAAKYLRQEYARREREAGKSEGDAEVAAGELVGARLKRVAEWLEAPGAPSTGIARESLLAVAERVRAWHQSRVRAGEVESFSLALAQVIAFADAITNDPRTHFTQEEVRQLFDRYARVEQRHDLAMERAGRVAHVAHPASLLGGRERVVLWSFVGGVERRPQRWPWNEEERAALSAAGVTLVEPAAVLASEAEAWRRTILAAREQIVFVVPRSIKGTRAIPHPLWDEVRARLSLDDETVVKLTREARDVRERGMAGVVVRSLAPLTLPEGRPTWKLPSEVVRAGATDRKMSVTALERIATCPLAWILEQRGGLHSGAMSRVAKGNLLNGGLTHRLVEELHAEGAFEKSEEVFVGRAAACFDALLRTEGATLLLPGASIERLQLTRQVEGAVKALYRHLVASGFRIAAVEEEISIPSAIGPLHGRLDLRLVDSEGRAAVLDVKWGGSAFRDSLERGRAVQLAVYARAVSATRPAPWGQPPAGYFACASGAVLTTDSRMRASRTLEGPSLEETWQRVQSTAKLVLEDQDRGIVHAPATRAKLRLLDALGVPAAEQERHFAAPPDAACGFCSFDAICGRKWSAIA